MAEKIAYVVSQYPTLSHTFIFREIRMLRESGLEIAVASIRGPDRPMSELTPDEREEANRTYYVRADIKRWIPLHIRALARFPAGYFRGLALSIRCAKWNLLQAGRNLRFFGEAVVAGQWILKRSANHIHTHFASLTTLLIERIFKIPFSMTIHGQDEFTDPSGFCMEEKVDAARLAVGISRYGCSQMMRFSDPRDWDKVAMVRLGIDPRDFRGVARSRRAERFEIVCVARLAKVKGHVFLLRALRKLIGTHPSMKLTIIGGGPEHANLLRAATDLGIQDAVEFTGGLANGAVRERVAQSDCFALASFAEGVPVVLMEAMALGVPCVATRVNGVPELIEDGREGLLVPPADVEALATAIERLILDRDLADRLSANGKAKILRDYDLNRNVPELKDRLLACIRQKNES